MIIPAKAPPPPSTRGTCPAWPVSTTWTSKKSNTGAGDDLTLISPVTGSEATSRRSTDGRDEPRKRGLKPWAVPVAILAVLASVYGGGVYVFSSRCLPNTTVDGVDCSLKSATELAALIESQTDGYTLAVMNDNQQFVEPDDGTIPATGDYVLYLIPEN